jgi:hypothetical protein
VACDIEHHVGKIRILVDSLLHHATPNVPAGLDYYIILYFILDICMSSLILTILPL